MHTIPDLMQRFPDMPKVIYVHGFPRWKWPIVRQCFAGCRTKFLAKDERVPDHSWLVLWGMAPLPAGLPGDVRVLRMEDGFIRSVGLGADLVRPLSWVVDSEGIYYDASRPSDLERILATSVFDEEICSLAAHLRTQIVEAGLTKYNVGLRAWRRPAGVGKVVLVPGQVESDASLAFGAPGIRTNIGLLQAVREANPDAYLIYKPHPDVLARLRLEGKDEQEAHQWCDEILTDVSIGELFRSVDEVHVLTSLAGFEALLRGNKVTCYGQPFYSGWGLTHDIIPNSRRGRTLTLDELVAGTLINYPLYLSRDGKHLISPEQALEALLSWRETTGGLPPWWQGLFRIVLRRVGGVR
ncbi:MAG: hypothetical protein WBX11_18370 [Thiobacillaceae bacterium]